jgi:Phage integrase family
MRPAEATVSRPFDLGDLDRERHLEGNNADGHLAWADAVLAAVEVGLPGDAVEVGSVGLAVRVGRAGLPPVRLHDLRHGAASMLIAAGQPVKIVPEILGHSTSSFTADVYVTC